MKKYTFSVCVSFDLAVTLTRKELQQWPDGREGELEPKDAVMERIEDRLTELIGKEFELIKRINVSTDGDWLLRVAD